MGIKRYEGKKLDGKINKASEDTETVDTNKLEKDGSNGALPTSDPLVAGALWNNSDVVNVSTGS